MIIKSILSQKFPIKTFILLLGLSFLSACGCNNSYMKDITIVKNEDKYSNCQTLVYNIMEAELLLKNVDDRCAKPHLFAQNILCTPNVKLDAARNQNILYKRLEYLKNLYKTKACKLHLKGNISEEEEIETQNKIAARRVKTALSIIE